jgi:hypothetical protein
VATRLLKRSVYNAWDLSWEQSLDEIAAKTAISDHHPDAREGGTAFREKRAPAYNKWLEDVVSKEHPGRVRLRNALGQLEGEVRRLGLSTDEVKSLGESLISKLQD